MADFGIDAQLVFDTDDKSVSTKLKEIANIVVNIENFPILPLETNDTGRLDRATNYLVSKGGGVLLLPTGEFVANYFKVKDKVMVTGQGASTILKLANGTNADFITLSNDSVRQAGLSNLLIDGNKENNTSSRGIYLTDPSYVIDSNQYYADNFLTVDTVFIRNCAGDGFRTDTNIREGQFNKIFSFRNNGDGIVIGGTDSFLRNSTSYWNVGTGIKIQGANHKLSNLKTFGNDYVGFWFNTVKRVIGFNLEAQENKNHGFMIGECSGISIVNALSDSNGYGTPTQPNNYNGFHLFNSSNIKIDGHATDFHKADTGLNGTQCYGINVSTTTNYDIRLRIDNQSYGLYLVDLASSGVLVVNGKERFVWETPTLLNSLGFVGGEELQYGKDSTGNVFLQGATTSANGVVAFVLPAAYRPTRTLYVTSTEGKYKIEPNGNVTIITTTSTGYFSYTFSFKVA